MNVEKWDYFEVILEAAVSGNPFRDVSLEAEFSHHHRRVRVDGFYDGDGIFKIRFMPDMEGKWDYVTFSNSPLLEGQRGELLCTAPTGENHGPVQVAHQYHFAYADKTPYYPVGTTCYVWNHQGDVLEQQTIATLKEAPFNKMRMCVFPKRYTFNMNEPPCYPFVGEVTQKWDISLLDNYRAQKPPDYWDFTQFNPEYFQKLERHILDLRRLNIEADLIIFHPYDFGAWGFDRMPADVNIRYLKYLVARLSAFRNVWWSFANEYDLMLDVTMNEWDDYFKIVQDADPYNHLRSIHNCRPFYDHRKPWVTHCSVQHQTLLEMPNWLQQYNKPVIVDECGYEGNIGRIWGSLSAEELVIRFWLGFAAGGYVGHGETYWNEEEVLWWSKGGVLHGESAPRIAFLRQIIEDAHIPGLFPLARSDKAARIIPNATWNLIAAGHSGDDYFLFYFGMHQPAFRNLTLLDGTYRIDVIDTWEMTIDTLAENASGEVQVNLPGKKYQALRIIKNNTFV